MRAGSNVKLCTKVLIRNQHTYQGSGVSYMPPKPENGATHSSLSPAQQAYLERVIRVDQAGELGADLIYAGQYLALSHNKKVKPIIKHMWEQEIHHRSTFNKLQSEHRVRPSILTPLWKAGAFGLGFATGFMNKEAAMACTEAVETVIGKHYNSQLRVLSNNFADLKDSNDKFSNSKEIEHLKGTIKVFRDQELEHLNTAIQNDSKNARPYWLLTETIKTVCKSAVFVAERI
ncbi:Catabolite repression protein cat5 [Pichia californica]|uniref:5-demethoxyubiquinone hydroxylase, mitochondrial n=1 Tax=Pichia californica TaxID=460514 RepID=A0A9P6WH72_9ASCO|nr:Catabolite repression protein cat5 [[Candida] californica]KAG0687105.1 Catabolite repression protein cat5 [[Candida] californica]